MKQLRTRKAQSARGQDNENPQLHRADSCDGLVYVAEYDHPTLTP